MMITIKKTCHVIVLCVILFFCTSCGNIQSFFTHNCSFTEEIVDVKYLKTSATITKSAIYYKSCVCGKKGEETFSYGKKKLPTFKNRSILILGDSYSTYADYIPKGYPTYYPKLDIHNVCETWWSIFAQDTQSTIIQNNSWSGSPISYTGYNNVDCSTSSSFIYRYKRLKQEGFFQTNNVDTVFVFGGTNDSWAVAPLGEIKFSDWSETDLYEVLPAICYLTYTLKNDLPNAEIVIIINTGINEKIQDCMELSAKYYGARFVRLEDIDKQNNHPTVKGMQAISEQIRNVCELAK